VAAGLAAAVGAVLTSMVDSRSTLAGTMLVAMAVSALGQAMRAPLGRLEQRLRFAGRSGQAGEPSARVTPAVAAGPGAPLAVPPARAQRQGGMGRSILLVGLLGFLIGMGVIGAREIAQGKVLAARLMERLQSDAPVRILVELAPTEPAPPALQAAGANEVEPEPKQAVAPSVGQAARRAAATSTPEPAATTTPGRPTPAPSALSSKAVATPAARSDAPASTRADRPAGTRLDQSPGTRTDGPATRSDAPGSSRSDQSASTTNTSNAPASPKSDAPTARARPD
jgi:hypothetical protein